MRPVRRCPLEAGEHGLDGLVEGEALLDAQLGRHADLGVDDAVVGQVLDALGGHPLDGLAASACTPTVCSKVSR